MPKVIRVEGQDVFGSSIGEKDFNYLVGNMMARLQLKRKRLMPHTWTFSNTRRARRALRRAKCL